MKPIGTVTKYYPFLSQGTVKTIERILDGASTYREFVRNLVDYTLAEETLDDLKHFTVIQRWHLSDPEVWHKVLPLTEEVLLLKPWSMVFKPPKYIGMDGEFRRVLVSLVEEALLLKPQPWLSLHLYFLVILKGWWEEYHKYIEPARTLIQNYPELGCFRPFLHWLEGDVKTFEGDIEGGIEILEVAYRIAKEQNDELFSARILNSIGSYCYSNTNPQRALEIFSEAQKLYFGLDAKQGLRAVISNMGYIYGILGEYDLGIRFYEEAMNVVPLPMEKVWETQTASLSTECAKILNDLDMPGQAIEWLKMKSESLDYQYYRPDIYLETARALSKSNREGEAKQQLAIASELVRKRAIDQETAYFDFVSGEFDLTIGNLTSARALLEKTYDDLITLNAQHLINSVLLTLTKLEISEAKQDSRYMDDMTSGKWMDTLETHARNKKYPGIRMQHALLKAEYQSMIGDYEATLLTLKDALTFSESPGVKTLRKRILERLSILEPA
ncbi:MAG: tetratricopeptide repeat protein [Candidatus Thorarchaeota archaeon]|jgi:tetratricopeptide (TPR) repeat protein